MIYRVVYSSSIYTRWEYNIARAREISRVERERVSGGFKKLRANSVRDIGPGSAAHELKVRPAAH